MSPSDKSRVLAVVHQETSRTGRVGQLLESWGYEVERCCPNIGHALPDDLSAYAGVVMFGGPMSANDCTTLPGIKAELAWLPKVLETQTPFLGICLGAQLMARVLGAKVDTHPEGRAEIGYVEINPAYPDCQIFPEKMHVERHTRAIKGGRSQCTGQKLSMASSAPGTGDMPRKIAENGVASRRSSRNPVPIHVLAARTGGIPRHR